MTTSNSVSPMCTPRWSGADPAGRVGLLGVGVELGLVGRVAVWSDVEDDLLDRAREHERLLAGIAAVDDQAVVPAHVEARVATESEGDGVIHPATSDPLAVDQ